MKLQSLNRLMILDFLVSVGQILYDFEERVYFKQLACDESSP